MIHYFTVKIETASSLPTVAAKDTERLHVAAVLQAAVNASAIPRIGWEFEVQLGCKYTSLTNSDIIGSAR